MADSTDNESISETVPKTLGAYLLDNVDGLKEFYAEFPAHNRKIKTPSVSVHVASPTFTNINPYPCSIGTVAANQAKVL